MIYDALTSGRLETAAEHVSEDALVIDVASGDEFHGPTGYLEHVRGWYSAFPDLRFLRLAIRAGDEFAVAEYEISGTHTGTLLTRRGHIPPTGMEVDVRFCDVLTIPNGRLTQLRSYFDSATLLRQLGLISATPLHATDRRASLELFVQPLDASSPQRNRAIVHRYLQNVFSRRNAGAAAETCAREFVWHGGSLGEFQGLQEYHEVLTSLFEAFPDFELELLDTVADGDRVVVRFKIGGTHTGVFQRLPPAGRYVTGAGTSTFRLESSRIVEEWWQGDLLAILQQIDSSGVTPRLFS